MESSAAWVNTSSKSSETRISRWLSRSSCNCCCTESHSFSSHQVAADEALERVWNLELTKGGVRNLACAPQHGLGRLREPLVDVQRNQRARIRVRPQRSSRPSMTTSAPPRSIIRSPNTARLRAFRSKSVTLAVKVLRFRGFSCHHVATVDRVPGPSSNQIAPSGTLQRQ